MTTKKCKWTQNEEQVLRDLVNLHGPKEWTKIASIMSKVYKTSAKTGKQCRERWTDHLCESITKAPWSPEEESLLLFHYSQLNSRWNHISELFPGRSINSVKNRFFSLARKSLRKMCHFTSSTAKDLNVYSIKSSTFTYIFQESIPADVLKAPQFLHEGWSKQNRLKKYLSAFMPGNKNTQKMHFSIPEILEAISDIVSLNQAYEEGKLSSKKAESNQQTSRGRRSQKKSAAIDGSLQDDGDDEAKQHDQGQDSNVRKIMQKSSPSIKDDYKIEDYLYGIDLDRYIFPSEASESNAILKECTTPPYDINQGLCYFF